MNALFKGSFSHWRQWPLQEYAGQNTVTSSFLIYSGQRNILDYPITIGPMISDNRRGMNSSSSIRIVIDHSCDRLTREERKDSALKAETWLMHFCDSHKGNREKRGRFSHNEDDSIPDETDSSITKVC